MAESEGRMSFLDHLRELRRRLWYSALTFAVALVAALFLSDRLLEFIVGPLFRAWASVPGMPTAEPSLHYANPVDPVFTILKLSLYAALFVSAPMLLFQLWRFVAPGLYPKEKRHAYPLLLGSFVFFIGGGIFGYTVVFPLGFEFLLRFGLELSADVPLDPTIMITNYVDLAVGLLFAFGLVFELPLVIIFLGRIGLVDHRMLLRFFRYFVVIAFALGAILTPTPDPLNQALMAGPLIILYLFATLVTFFIGKGRSKTEREPPEPDAGGSPAG
jgi:sec-independent protein translocase protein TatC